MPGPDLAPQVIDALRQADVSIAIAESLTAGLVCARLADVPGASDVLRGGVVAYATDLKHELLGVAADTLSRHGVVHPQVAAEMSRSVRVLLGADIGAATTGVAGPGPTDGHPAGTVFVAATARRGIQSHRTEIRALRLPGTRGQVRAASVDAVFALILELVQPDAARFPGSDPGR